MTQTPTAPNAIVQSILEKAKGIFPDPYPWQIDAWRHMFGEKTRDVLVIAGTGSGKSLIFQCLHLGKKDSLSLIISPLIALMVDQVFSSLRDIGANN